ncbi:MAG: penicillin-binding protein, partial [Shinella sp.]|nr:penicillin-binding protein [Shinella sp.]
MAANRKSQRIEPSFQASGGRDDDDFHVGAGDRVAGSGGRKPRGKTAKAEKPQRGARRRRGGSGGGGLFGLVRRLIYWCVVLGIWGAIGVGGLVLYYGARMPSATSWSIPDRPPNIKILAVSGDTIANRGLTGGEALSLENMSPYIPQAVIAIEDRRFYSHFGIDPLGLARAMLTNVTTGRMVQGGSTLTQQLAKNLFLTNERSIERKIKEAFLSLWLEANLSKKEILSLYLDRAYMGGGTFGAAAAAQFYFGKNITEVNPV